jgi:hypothetical protein
MALEEILCESNDAQHDDHYYDESDAESDPENCLLKSCRDERSEQD